MPMQMVMSSPLAGAEITTFFAPPARWPLAFSASVNRPVDSMTISAPTEDQGSLAGSFSANTLISLPSILRSLPTASTVPGYGPNVESYLKRFAFIFASVRSLIATTWMSGFLREARMTRRPMRPKPLMPTLMAMDKSSVPALRPGMEAS